MKQVALFLILAGLASAAGPARFTGVVTDTMCGRDHSMMGVKPDAKCVRECVHSGGGKVKYALLTPGGKIYVLSDQQTPERYAAQKVTVTGELFEKTGILRADKIDAAR
jgi:hypothetical protein